MNKKQFAVSAAAFIVALVLVSCEPLRGCAVEIGFEDQAGINDYFQASGQNLSAVEIDYNVDEDGNRNAHLAIIGLQRAALAEQTKIYSQLDFSIAPATVSVSGSANVGTYLYQGSQYPVTVYTSPSGYDITIENTASFPVASSPHFNLMLHLNGNNVKWVMSDPRYGWFTSPINGGEPSSGTYSTTGGGSIFADNSADIILYSQLGIYWRGISSDYVPTLISPAYTSEYISCMGAANNYFGGLGVTVNLPQSDVDTAKPWDYYNNVLLPYIENNYGDITDYQDFLIFPDGYQPPAQPTTVPVVHPTLPGFDFALETNGTEPPTDVNYNIPDLPGKDIAVPAFDFTQINPHEVMSPVAGGLRGIWELVGNVLTEYNLFPYVGIAVFAAIVFALLRLGK